MVPNTQIFISEILVKMPCFGQIIPLNEFTLVFRVAAALFHFTLRRFHSAPPNRCAPLFGLLLSRLRVPQASSPFCRLSLRRDLHAGIYLYEIRLLAIRRVPRVTTLRGIARITFGQSKLDKLSLPFQRGKNGESNTSLFPSYHTPRPRPSSSHTLSCILTWTVLSLLLVGSVGRAVRPDTLPHAAARIMEASTFGELQSQSAS